MNLYPKGIRLMYTRERKNIGSIWSSVTCLALPLAAQSLAHQAPVSSQSHWCLKIVTGNKQYKQINKHYIINEQTVPKDGTSHEHMSARIT
jgi:hypothetical protein